MRQTAYFYSISSLILGYLLFEYFFIPYEALAADEFVFARHILDYTNSLPYRDFAPYKSVLGHYLLSIPLFFSHTLFNAIFYMKDEVALLNAACLALTCYWGAQLFNRTAVLLTILALLANHSFLMYSTDLRVDMLAAWICLFAALSVLQNRLSLGGILSGLAFLISQKTLWYIIAINGAMLICMLTIKPTFYTLRSCWRFNIAAAAIVLLYLACWSLITSPALVFSNFFYDAYIQAGIDFYLPIYLLCWKMTLRYGPMLFLLWPITWLSLFFLSDNAAANQKSVFTVYFASIALLLFITYKQPFPYNFVLTVPAFFLLYANFFSWLPNQVSKNKCYFLAGFFIITAIAFPFYKALKGSLKFNGSYQRTMTMLTAELLENEGDYIGGIPLIFTKEQPIIGMKNLIGPQIEFISTQDEKMRPLLLPSLYLSPTTTAKIIEDFERASVKVLITNYRINILPPALKTYLFEHYQHYYGSVYLYAPTIHASQLSFYLSFSGKYRIAAKTKTRVRIDGKYLRAGQIITLKQGDHVTDAKINYRLVLIPKVKMPLNPEFQEDNWLKMLKAIVA